LPTIFAQHVASCEINNGSQGDVWANNYSVDNYYTGSGTAPRFQQSDSYPSHQNGDDFSLFEGNVGQKFAADDIHGNSWMGTGFRNRWTGLDGVFKNSSIMPVYIEAGSRYYNLLYNVLGTTGTHTSYQTNPVLTTSCGFSNTSIAPLSIYTLGWSFGNGGLFGTTGICTFFGQSFTIYNDLSVASASTGTLYRWGNYDTVNTATQYNTGEVPTGLASYAQTVPTTACTSTTSCPASFFYSSQPSYWSTTFGTPPWPAIGPDVAIRWSHARNDVPASKLSKLRQARK
jgi:hypothetical protein